MPCSEGNAITSKEIFSFLGVLQEQALSSEEIAKRLNLPMFQTKSKLRELVKLGYIEEQGENFSVKNKTQ